MRLVVRFVLAVLLADGRRGRQPVAEPLPQRGKEGRVDRLAGGNRGRHRTGHLVKRGRPSITPRPVSGQSAYRNLLLGRGGGRVRGKLADCETVCRRAAS